MALIRKVFKHIWIRRIFSREQQVKFVRRETQVTFRKAGVKRVFNY